MKEVGLNRREFLRNSVGLSVAAAWLVLSGGYIGKILEYADESTIDKPLWQKPKNDSLLVAAAPDRGIYKKNLFDDFSVIHLFFHEHELLSPRMLTINQIRADGKVPLVTIDPEIRSDGTFRFRRDMKVFLDKMRPFLIWLGSKKSPVFLRTFYEMNGNWTIYGPQINKPEDFIYGFRQMSEEVRKYVPEAEIIFCPNGGIPFGQYNPGEAYFDIAGLDVYNKFRTVPPAAIQFPNSSFEKAHYGDIRKMQESTDKKIMVVETGMADRERREEWFFKGLSQFPLMKNVTGFGVFLFDKEGQGPGETDWDMTTDKRQWSSVTKMIQASPYAKKKAPIML